MRLFTPNFTLLILGQVSSLVGNYTLKFALSMYVLEQTGSAGIFAGLLAGSMVPTILLSPLGGVLADRADRRRVMVALDALSGGWVLAAALVLPLGPRLPVIGVLLVALSALAAFESPTVQACIPQLLAGDNLLRGNAAVSQIQALAGLVTPFLGSAAYTAFGLFPVLWGAALCFFLTALLECFLKLEYRPLGEAGGVGAIILGDLRQSVDFLRTGQPGLLKLLLLAALVSLFVAGTAVVGFPYLVRTVLGLPAAYYGAAESAMGAAAILGGLLVGILARKLRPGWLAGVFVGFGLCLIPCGLTFVLPLTSQGRFAVLLAMFCLCQLGCSLFSTYTISMLQRRTPDHLMGKVMSFVFSLSLCAQPVGQLVYGALFDRFAHCPHWVLFPSGLAVCAIGLASGGFFARLEGQK